MRLLKAVVRRKNEGGAFVSGERHCESAESSNLRGEAAKAGARTRTSAPA